MPHVQSSVRAGEVWARDGYLYMEIVGYDSADGRRYWVTDETIFWDYAAAADHLADCGFLPFDARSEGA